MSGNGTYSEISDRRIYRERPGPQDPRRRWAVLFAQGPVPTLNPALMASGVFKRPRTQPFDPRPYWIPLHFEEPPPFCPLQQGVYQAALDRRPRQEPFHPSRLWCPLFFEEPPPDSPLENGVFGLYQLWDRTYIQPDISFTQRQNAIFGGNPGPSPGVGGCPDPCEGGGSQTRNQKPYPYAKWSGSRRR